MTRREEAIEKAAGAFEDAWDGGIESGAVDDLTPTEFIHKAMGAAVEAYEAHIYPEVTSVEELNALPVGSVIISAPGNVWTAEQSIVTGRLIWVETGDNTGASSGEILTPARVIHLGQP